MKKPKKYLYCALICFLGWAAIPQANAAGTMLHNSAVTKRSTGSAIAVDGYYDDWKNIDIKDAITWKSYNNTCHHTAGIYMDEKYVYVHVKMNDLYTSQIPVTAYHLKINGEKDVDFSAQYQTVSGEIDWSGNPYNLPVGTSRLAVFYNQWPKYNLGDIAVTVRENHVGDEMEFRVSLQTLSRITGIPVESMATISFYCPNMGAESVTTSGTSTGAGMGVASAIAVAGCVLYKRKRKQELPKI